MWVNYNDPTQKTSTKPHKEKKKKENGEREEGFCMDAELLFSKIVPKYVSTKLNTQQKVRKTSISELIIESKGL